MVVSETATTIEGMAVALSLYFHADPVIGIRSSLAPAQLAMLGLFDHTVLTSWCVAMRRISTSMMSFTFINTIAKKNDLLYS